MNTRPSPAERKHLARVKDVKACAVSGCAKPHLARGYCQNHYMQLKRQGSPAVANIERETDAAYIANRVRLDEGGCWNWTQSTRSGYGRLVRQGRSWSAHVFSYVAHVGPVPSVGTPRASPTWLALSAKPQARARFTKSAKGSGS